MLKQALTMHNLKVGSNILAVESVLLRSLLTNLQKDRNLCEDLEGQIFTKPEPESEYCNLKLAVARVMNINEWGCWYNCQMYRDDNDDEDEAINSARLHGWTVYYICPIHHGALPEVCHIYEPTASHSIL